MKCGYIVPILVIYVGCRVLDLYGWFVGVYVFIGITLLCRNLEICNIKGGVDEFVIFRLGVVGVVFVHFCGFVF